MSQWTTDTMPSQQGRSVVLTGTGGLGYETALALAAAGAEVIIAGRSAQKGAEAIRQIRSEVPSATVAFEQVDLASLKSIAAFADRLKGKRDSLDLLINNAGVMVPPTRATTADHFELQFGTNYLGHFALTAHLLPLLMKGRDPRVVTLGSIGARSGTINFEDLNSSRSYDKRAAYAQSKLACIMFARELQRRSTAGGWGITSIGAHPGVSRTNLLLNAPGRFSVDRIFRTLFPFAFQPAAQGALPTLFAATDPTARGGEYYGPDRMNETRGHPAVARVPAAGLDELAATRLWQVSEELARIRFDEQVRHTKLKNQAA